MPYRSPANDNDKFIFEKGHFLRASESDLVIENGYKADSTEICAQMDNDTTQTNINPPKSFAALNNKRKVYALSQLHAKKRARYTNTSLKATRTANTLALFNRVALSRSKSNEILRRTSESLLQEKRVVYFKSIRIAKVGCTSELHTVKNKPLESFGFNSILCYLEDMPPINRHTLRELNLQRILQNPKLRHEIVFESKLEFRPNSFGNLPHLKDEKTKAYWERVTSDLEVLPSNSSSIEYSSSKFVKRIVALFIEIKCIILEILLDMDEQSEVAKNIKFHLDEDLLFKLIESGNFNPTEVSEHLLNAVSTVASSKLNKNLDSVKSSICSGKLVDAFKEFFEILEKIKIDYANQNIELYRSYMLSSAVQFEKSNFLTLFHKKHIALAETKEWWKSTSEKYKKATSSAKALFAEGILDLLQNDPVKLPEILYLSETRVAFFKKEMLKIRLLSCIMLGTTQFFEQAAIKQNHTFFKKVEEFLKVFMLPTSCEYSSPNSGDVYFSNIYLGIIDLVDSRVKDSSTWEQRKLSFKSFLRSLIRKNSGVLKMISNRLRQVVIESANSTPEEIQRILEKHRLQPFAEYCIPLAAKISKLVDYHWQIYGSFFFPKTNPEST